MQDGVPLNLADGSFDFQVIEPMATRYIEVYRGANALQFGAATLGGAINYVSPTGYDAPPLQIRGEVRWQKEASPGGPWFIGVQFRRVSPGDRDALKSYIDLRFSKPVLDTNRAMFD